MVTQQQNGSDIFQMSLEDEDGQSVLGIDDGALRQSLHIRIVNTSGEDIELMKIDNINGTHYNFAVSFRLGTLRDVSSIKFNETNGWKIYPNNHTFYFGISENKTIKNGDSITFTLENIGAAPAGGARGTRVEIKFVNLYYEDSKEIISGNRLLYLNIVNQRGKKQVPLSASFLGSNTILNDGTENELTLTIQSVPNTNLPLSVSIGMKVEELNGNVPHRVTRWQGDILKIVTETIKDGKEYLNQLPPALLNKINNNEKTSYKSFEDFLTTAKQKSFKQFSEAYKDLPENNKQEVINKIKKLLQQLSVISKQDLQMILSQLKSLGIDEAVITQMNPIIEKLNIINCEVEERQQGNLNAKGLEDGNIEMDEATKITISLDVAVDDDDNDSKHWALVEKTNADDVLFTIAKKQENWVFGGKFEQGITPTWSFICKQGLSIDRKEHKEILRLNISNLKTRLKSGYANLYVHYQNIPGYWDGFITVPIHKGPIVYREDDSGEIGCIGIGTDEPKAKLHVKSTDNLTALKVEGSTINNDLIYAENQGTGAILRAKGNSESFSVIVAENKGSNNALYLKGNPNALRVDGDSQINGNTTIAGNLAVSQAIQPSVGNSDNNGIIFPKDPFGGSGDKAWIRYYRRGNSGEDTILEIGNANDTGDHIALMPNNGNVGIGTSNPTAKLHVEGITSTQCLSIQNWSLNAHINHDGAIYRKEGQVYITVDDNFYIRDSGSNDNNPSIHIDTNLKSLRVYGSLYVHEMPYGDKKNVQWDHKTYQFFQDNSSRKSKENITSLEDEFFKIMQIEPKTYTRPGNSNVWEIGYIAEEFDELGLNNLVYYEEDGSPDAIHYDKISIYLVEIIKKLYGKINDYEERINYLEQSQ